ncbi:hypothetical protein SMD11_1267 [Streptomyces albireticuli]|uniref:Uncharacterized protein n=1 Tax=Streptomyces albireticuli TaxID=1940 RepID=A0A1Z2KY06_9ACTN|nr:hypothetical protein SMD11_1267 [Streptomyces albireticuli]
MMARKMIEQVTCDACAAKGVTSTGVAELTIGSVSYDLCQEHTDRFGAYFADLFGATPAAVAA